MKHIDNNTTPSLLSRLSRSAAAPASWIPTLYFAQGLPYVAVMTLSVILYKRLGLPNDSIALLTGWLYLPWVIKPFWSPIVDIFSTRRAWTIAKQLLLAVAFGAVTLALTAPTTVGWSLAAFAAVAFLSATHDIASDGFYMLALDTREQSIYVGIRSTFYRIATVVGQGALVVLAGYIEETTGDIPFAWMVVMGSLSAFFLLVAIYHSAVMPRPKADHRAETRSLTGALRTAADTFVTFFSKPGIGMALLFILLYRFPEAQLVKLINPFLLDPVEAGGLGLTTAQVGIVYGTVGIIGLSLGGILGGFIVARYGLRRCMMPLAWCMSLTCIVFVYLSFQQATPLWAVCTCVSIEQLGYGLGFTAYMLYLIKFSEGPSATTHYALCTGFMALGMMLPGMAAGHLQQLMGYQGFFVWTMVCCVATIAVAMRVSRSGLSS